KRALKILFFFSSRRRHTRCLSDWSSDVCSSDLETIVVCVRNKPVAQLVPLPRAKKRRPIGLYKGQFKVPDDFNDPLPDWLLDARSEERRVGKEWKSRGAAEDAEKEDRVTRNNQK